MKRINKTYDDECKYYEVSDFYAYLIEVCLNGNFTRYKELYNELGCKYKKEYILYVIECYANSSETLRQLIIYLI